jgi:hypothetical protein
MKIIIRESQLNELERDWMGKDSEEQYTRLKEPLVNRVKDMIKGYSENEKGIDLYDSEEKLLIVYLKSNGEVYYSSTLYDLMLSILPHPIWYRHGKYVIADVFESFFPQYRVTRVSTASFARF